MSPIDCFSYLSRWDILVSSNQFLKFFMIPERYLGSWVVEYVAAVVPIVIIDLGFDFLK